MIDTIDLKTYYNINGYFKIYALRFYIDNRDLIIFYIDKNENSYILVLRYFDALLINKYNNYIFYAYNLGSYNSLFFLKYWNKLI